MPVLIIQLIISIISGALLVAHIFLPEARIDSITVILVVLSIAPWLAPLIKSFELPGGLKIEFQEWKDAKSKAEASGVIKYNNTFDDGEYTFQLIAKTDPSLALAGLRIEIEKRLRSLAKEYEVQECERLSGRALLAKLADLKVLSFDETSAVWRIVAILDKAVHGAEVKDFIAQDVIQVGPAILKMLDDKKKLRGI